MAHHRHAPASLSPHPSAIGNHDIWSYESEGGHETATPEGDALFGATFGPGLLASPAVLDYSNLTVFNPLHNFTSTFQNSEVELIEPASGARLRFYLLDWNTRDKAIDSNESGVMGWAERTLSDFPGGSLPWLAERLAAAAAAPPAARPDALFLVQHQPVRCPVYVVDAAFCFGALDKALLQKTLTSSWPREAWGAIFAGHIHLFANGTAFDNWVELRQLLVSAAKGDAFFSPEMTSAIMTVAFEGPRAIEVNWTYWVREWASNTIPAGAAPLVPLVLVPPVPPRGSRKSRVQVWCNKLMHSPPHPPGQQLRVASYAWAMTLEAWIQPTKKQDPTRGKG